MSKIKSTISYLKGPGPMFLTLWFIWILVGALFYSFAPMSGLGITKGFYQAVNIGYSIGFGYPTESHEPYFYFSTMYVLIGSSFVAVALGFFAEKITEDQENWFTIMQQKKMYQEAFQDATQVRKQLKVLIVRNLAVIRSVGLWLVFLSMMITYSMYNVEWSFTQAQYFAVTTLSTGGHWKIPDNSDTWLFGVTGLMTMIGVPITALAMAQVARALIDMGDIESTKEILSADVTAEELKMLVEFGLEDGDGFIDRSEFVILCMVRIGTDPELIHYIAQRFDAMDTDGTGGIPIDRISKGNATFVNGKVRRTASVIGTDADATKLLQQLNVGSRNIMYQSTPVGTPVPSDEAETPLFDEQPAKKVDYSRMGVSSRIMMKFDFSDSSESGSGEEEEEQDDDDSVKKEDMDLRGSLHQTRRVSDNSSSMDLMDGSQLSYVNMENYRGPLNHSYASYPPPEDNSSKNPYFSATTIQEDDEDESGDEFAEEVEDEETEGEDEETEAEYGEWVDEDEDVEEGGEDEDEVMDMNDRRKSFSLDSLPNTLTASVLSPDLMHSSTLALSAVNLHLEESTQETQEIEQRISMHSHSSDFRVRESTRGFQLDNLPNNMRASSLTSSVMRSPVLSLKELEKSIILEDSNSTQSKASKSQQESFNDEDVDDNVPIKSAEVDAEPDNGNASSSGFQRANRRSSRINKSITIPTMKSVMPAMDDSAKYSDTSNHLFMSPKELEEAQKLHAKLEEEKILENESLSDQSITSSRSSSTEKRDPESPLDEYDQKKMPGGFPIGSNGMLTGDNMGASFAEHKIGDLELESKLDPVETMPRQGIGNQKILGLVLNKPNVPTVTGKSVPYGGDSPSLPQEHEGRDSVNEEKLNEDTKQRIFTYRAFSGGDAISYEVAECVRLDAEDSQRVNEFYFV